MKTFLLDDGNDTFVVKASNITAAKRKFAKVDGGPVRGLKVREIRCPKSGIIRLQTLWS